MKYIFILLFLLITNFTKAQQLIHICYENNTSFTYITLATGEGTIQWYLDNVYIGSGEDIKLDWSLYSPGSHILMADFVSSTGCDAEPVYYYIDILDCDEFNIYIPNAFSPNNNGLNDTWFPIAHNYKDLIFWIYDRWGEMIFYSHGDKWGGTYHDVNCKIGVYVYVVIGIDLYDNIHQFKGNITLIR